MQRAELEESIRANEEKLALERGKLLDLENVAAVSLASGVVAGGGDDQGMEEEEDQEADPVVVAAAAGLGSQCCGTTAESADSKVSPSP